MVKRTPTAALKTLKTRPLRHGRRKKSPVKNAAGSLVTSINRSIYTCHRRLAKIFKKLARIATPKTTPRKVRYRVLDKSPAIQLDVTPVRRSLFGEISLLPLPLFPEKKTIFLDLDETLVHSTPHIPPEKFDFIVRPVISGQKIDFYVLKRPFVDEFLLFLSQKFEIVVFTAGIEEYASLVIDKLDWRKVISHRLYRDSCKQKDGNFVKDLSEIGRELKKVMILDDNPSSYQFQPENAIPIKSFTDDIEDQELKKMIERFEGFDEVEDVREAIKLSLSNLKEDDKV